MSQYFPQPEYSESAFQIYYSSSHSSATLLALVDAQFCFSLVPASTSLCLSYSVCPSTCCFSLFIYLSQYIDAPLALFTLSVNTHRG